MTSQVYWEKMRGHQILTHARAAAVLTALQAEQLIEHEGVRATWACFVYQSHEIVTYISMALVAAKV